MYNPERLKYKYKTLFFLLNFQPLTIHPSPPLPFKMLRASVVNNTSLAAVGRELGLQEYALIDKKQVRWRGGEAVEFCTHCPILCSICLLCLFSVNMNSCAVSPVWHCNRGREGVCCIPSVAL